MRAFISLLIFLVISAPAVASGQDYIRFRLPEGHRLTVSGETYQGFTLDEYRELLHIDSDLRILTSSHELDLARIAEMTIAASELQLSLDTCNAEVTLLGTERVRLTRLWEEENRLRNDAEQQPDWTWVPWTLAGGFAISTVVLALIVGIQ